MSNFSAFHNELQEMTKHRVRGKKKKKTLFMSHVVITVTLLKVGLKSMKQQLPTYAHSTPTD